MTYQNRAYRHLETNEVIIAGAVYSRDRRKWTVFTTKNDEYHKGYGDYDTLLQGWGAVSRDLIPLGYNPDGE